MGWLVKGRSYCKLVCHVIWAYYEGQAQFQHKKELRYDDEARRQKSIRGSTMNNWMKKSRKREKKVLCHVIQPQCFVLLSRFSSPTKMVVLVLSKHAKISFEWMKNGKHIGKHPFELLLVLKLFPTRMRSLNSRRVRKTRYQHIRIKNILENIQVEGCDP